LERELALSHEKMIRSRQEANREILDKYDEVLDRLREVTEAALGRVKNAYRYAINNPQLLS